MSEHKDKSIREIINIGFEESFSDDNGCWGFYDWFCKDTSLKNKGKRLFTIVKGIAKKTKKFDIDKCYVFFKNNCPCYGDYRLYDDVRICDIESGDVIFNITPRDPFGHTMVYCEGHGFESETKGYKFNNVKEMKKWFAEEV